MQHALKLCKYLRPGDVGADIIRPRAADCRPYGFYQQFAEFWNTYFPGLKLSFRLTERLNTRWSGVQSLLSGQK